MTALGTGLLRAVLALLFTAADVRARELVHSLAQGETLRAAAERYYGDERWAESLALHNGLDPRAALVAGQQIRIPLADLHEIGPDDSWALLAEQYWGDAGRHRELAELSGRLQAMLEPGGEVRIPALIPLRIRPGESLAAVSRRIYGDPERADAIGRLNRLDHPELLEVGQLVRVPVLRLDPEELPPPSLPEPAKFSAATARVPAVGSGAVEGPAAAPPVDPRLIEGIETYRAGQYAQALEILEALAGDQDFGDVADREALFRHLIFLYVAFERTPDACARLSELRRIHPEVGWDPAVTSPKVIDQLTRCGQ